MHRPRLRRLEPAQGQAGRRRAPAGRRGPRGASRRPGSAACPQLRLPEVAYDLPDGAPKTVDFWLMRAGDGPAAEIADPTEVDAVAWLPPAEAAARLTLSRRSRACSSTSPRCRRSPRSRRWSGTRTPASARSGPATTRCARSTRRARPRRNGSPWCWRCFEPRRLIAATPLRCKQTLRAAGRPAGSADRRGRRVRRAGRPRRGAGQGEDGRGPAGRAARRRRDRGDLQSGQGDAAAAGAAARARTTRRRTRRPRAAAGCSPGPATDSPGCRGSEPTALASSDVFGAGVAAPRRGGHRVGPPVSDQVAGQPAGPPQLVAARFPVPVRQQRHPPATSARCRYQPSNGTSAEPRVPPPVRRRAAPSTYTAAPDQRTGDEPVEQPVAGPALDQVAERPPGYHGGGEDARRRPATG